MKKTKKSVAKGKSTPPKKKIAGSTGNPRQGVNIPASDPKFVQDLLARGEAAELNDNGKLPLKATHIIEKKKADGTPQVKRARLKLF